VVEAEEEQAVDTARSDLKSVAEGTGFIEKVAQPESPK